METAAGGRLHWDITDGLGPELYERQQAPAGTFETLIHYFGDRSAGLRVPAGVLLVRDGEPGAPRLFQLRLLPEVDAVFALR
jgi:hypothetical protein